MKRIICFFNLVLASVLAWLGYSCTTSIECEYGIPHIDYEISGHVVDAEDGKPIPNVGVVYHHHGYIKYLLADSVRAQHRFDYIPWRTEQDGSFVMRGKEDAFDVVEGYVYFVDTDGTVNGSYTLDSVYVSAEPDSTMGDGFWLRGKAMIDLGTIELHPVDTDTIRK